MCIKKASDFSGFELLGSRSNREMPVLFNHNLNIGANVYLSVNIYMYYLIIILNIGANVYLSVNIYMYYLIIILNIGANVYLSVDICIYFLSMSPLAWACVYATLNIYFIQLCLQLIELVFMQQYIFIYFKL